MIEKTPYGYKCEMRGLYSPDEAAGCLAKAKEIIGPSKRPFGQLIDVRGQKTNPPETQDLVQEMMTYVREHGLERSAVVVDSATLRMQIVRLAKQTGMYDYERYIDASERDDWEQAALDWIERGIDPDAS